jgi:hypothetical protein
MADKSLGFSPDVYRKFIAEWTEGPFLDFKSRMYEFGKDEVKQLEFAKDVIAFANVARRTGQPCYIVFGYDSKNVQVFSIHGQYPDQHPSPGISPADAMTDSVLKTLQETAKNWIQPRDPELFLEWGDYQGNFVAWLEIKPEKADQAFKLKRAAKSFTRGAVFLRKGSESALVQPDQVQYLCSVSEADYLQRKHWQSLVEHHRREGSEARKFWMLPDYVEIRTSHTGASAEQTVLQLLTEGKRRILVTAPAGVGKTVLLHRLAYVLAQRHPERVTDTDYFGQNDSPDTGAPEVIDRVDTLEVVPAQPVPMYMTLRATYETIDIFAKDLIKHVQEISGHSGIRSPETLFTIPNSKWVLLLDGVDELGNREEFGDKLQGWIRQLPPNVQVVLSARPYAAHHEAAEAEVKLAELTPDEINQRLELEQWSADDLASVRDFLAEQSDLYILLRRHRMLNGLLAAARRGVAADAPAPIRSEIDQPQVEVQEATSFTPSAAETEAPPVLTVAEDPTPGADPNDDSEDDEPPLPLQLAELLEGMVNEMQDQEIKRRNKLGASANDLARQSLAHLQVVGWEVEWDRDTFDPYRAEHKGWWEKDSRLWNEEIGFVNALPNNQAQFVCGLFHCYLAAKYGDRESDSVVRERTAAQTGKPERTQLVLRLIDELRAQRGAQTLA